MLSVQLQFHGVGTGGLSARGARNWSSHDCCHGAKRAVAFRPDLLCYTDSSMLEESERRHRFAVGHTKSHQLGQGDEVLAGVEEEEKGGHGPWNLRRHAKVLSQEHHVPLQGSFPSHP